MNRELQEQLECWVDNELDAATTRRLTELVNRDGEARELADRLRAFRRELRDHEPAPSIPVASEFYWSQIRRGIEAGDVGSRPTGSPADRTNWAQRWLRWLMPAAGLAAVVYLVVRPGSLGPPPPGSLSAAAPAMVGHVIEQQLPTMTTLTFYSAQDATTVVWVGRIDIL